jgi:hypothetical protein
MREKKIVILAIAHEFQQIGNPGNAKLEECVRYLGRKFKVQVVMEEWTEEQGPTIAAELVPKLGLGFAKIGTPADEPFRTCWPQISHPAHDGTLPYDPDAPTILHEYGPLDAQNAREQQMLRNIREKMEDYTGGIFIVGIAHTHSLHSQLVSRGFDVTTYVLAC